MSTSTRQLVTESMQDVSLKNKKKSFKTMTINEKMYYIKNYITVEPLVASYVMASLICGPALFNLEFEKSCRVNLNLNDTVCEAILNGVEHNYTDINDQIQVLIGNMHSWQLPLQSIMPLILILFLGSYSDRHKLRKPFLLLPIFGEFFAVFGCILCVVFMKTWPLEAQGVSQTVISSFFGGQTMLVMAVFAYIADISSLEMRTLRIGIVQIVLNVCTPITQSFSGILFEKIGYYGVLGIAALFYIFGFLYGLFWINEPKQMDENIEKKNLLVDIFDPKHAYDTFNLLIKKSPKNNRTFICLLMIILFVYSTVATGEGSIIYLYLQNLFRWGPVEYSYFITVNTMIHLIGTAIGLPFFTNILKLGDYMILVITFLDKIITNIVLGLAKTITMLYAGLVVSFITGISGVAIRSLATKVVSENDLGKAQSLFGICEALGPAIAVPLYNKGIYINTLDSFPAAYFFFGIILYCISIIIIFWIYFKDRNTVMPLENNIEKPTIIEEVQITHM